MNTRLESRLACALLLASGALAGCDDHAHDTDAGGGGGKDASTPTPGLDASTAPKDAGATTPDAGTLVVPSVTIGKPAANAKVLLMSDADRSLDVEFTVKDFTLKSPGACAGAANCGHVHLRIDGAACDKAGSPYNNVGTASPIKALFAACGPARLKGEHTLTLELHADDHTAIKDAAGSEVKAEVKVTVELPPLIEILAPVNGAIVDHKDDADKVVPVDFRIESFTLKEAGSCAGAAACGHVHLLVDGAACVSTGKTYNNAGATSPIDAKMAACATPTGTHELVLELHNDDHSPVKDPAGNVVASKTKIAVVAKKIEVEIEPLADGAVVAHAANVDKAVPIPFKVVGITLKPAGSCAGNPACGHVHLHVDGNACNTSGSPYNNSGWASPMDAKLASCANPLGTHDVAITLHGDDHARLKERHGFPFLGFTRITAVPSGSPSLELTGPQHAAVLGTDADKSVGVEFKVAGFSLMAPGSCAGAANCGHVHLHVDGVACNAAGASFNNSGAASPIKAKLAACPVATGRHVLSLGLHDDSHAAVKDAGGRPIAVSSEVFFVDSADTDPNVFLAYPAQSAWHPIWEGPGHGSVAYVKALNFITKAPGACAGAAKCGHVHMLIDGKDCNFPGAPYNNAGRDEEIGLVYGACKDPEGPHVVRVELKNDDHSQVRTSAGKDVADERQITACKLGAPCVKLTWPLAGMTLPMTGTDKAIPVDYAVDHFTLKAPGDCKGARDCGHVHLLVDGAACNSSGMAYNNTGSVGPLMAKMASCASPAGDHVITVELHGDDHTPIKTLAGNVYSSKVKITTK